MDRRFTLLASALALIASCARAPVQSPKEALRKVAAPELADDLPLEPLLAAIQDQLKLFDASVGNTMSFGERILTRAEYAKGLRRVQELAQREPDKQKFLGLLQEEFDFYEVYGQESWGDVFITSYFDPLIKGSLKPTREFSRPLYRAPADMLELDLGRFDPKFSGERKYRARIDGTSLVPYYTRKEIDTDGVLKGRKLEICWVDPLDSFFMQIQGSGTVDLGGGRILRINYANKNGQPYEPVGKFLKGKIPPENLNLATIEAYLRRLSPAEMEEYLNLNPSYVFFRDSQESAVTYLGVQATDGRTIATDSKYFPKGALAFLSFPKPVFASSEEVVPTSAETTSRLVLDQDIGGAITGPGRVDLFWGRGAEAKRYAGAMKARGTLTYLVPKPEAK